MRIFNSLTDFGQPDSGSVVTVGNFDGVHLGHQAIINHARRIADDENLPLTVFTFEPAPVKLLRPDRAPRILTPIETKTLMLEQLGVDQLIIFRATPDFLALSAQQFTQQVLLERLGARHMVEGQTFCFGQHRTGTTLSLQELGRQYGFEAHLLNSRTIDLENSNPVPVSSTLIRQHITTSRFDRAAQCLGRHYTLAGRVIRGHGTGGKLGFPTANLQLYNPDQMLPEDGVFAGYAYLGHDSKSAYHNKHPYQAAVSIGRRETFAESTWQIEAYLLDCPADVTNLYGQHMMLAPVQRLRSQQRFSSLETLAQAIRQDCRDVENTLKSKGISKI